MPSNIKVYKGVKIGKNTILGDFVVLGVPPKAMIKKDKLETIIGDNATVRSHSIIYADNKIGDNFQTGHGVLIREKNEIGNNVSIGSHSVVEHHVKIGNNVRIHTGAFIPEYTVLEDNVWIGPHAVLTNAKYPASKEAKRHLAGPKIRAKAKIGAGAVILPGIIIGCNALVGAGSIVTKNIPDGKVVVGNPAKIIGEVDRLVYENGVKAYS